MNFKGKRDVDDKRKGFIIAIMFPQILTRNRTALKQKDLFWQSSTEMFAYELLLVSICHRTSGYTFIFHHNSHIYSIVSQPFFITRYFQYKKKI